MVPGHNFKHMLKKLETEKIYINTLDFYPRPRLLPSTLDFEPSTLDPRLLATGIHVADTRNVSDVSDAHGNVARFMYPSIGYSKKVCTHWC